MKDVVIIGGGVIGLCCAWYLNEEGREVTILEKGTFSDGCSHGNAGMIVPSHFTPLASPGMIAKGLQWMFKKQSPFYIRPRLNMELMHWLWLFYKSSTRQHVGACAALLRDMHEESREFYRQLQHSAYFDFGFDQKGILMLYRTEKAAGEELEMADAAQSIGIEAIPMDLSQLRAVDPLISNHVKGGVHYPGDANITPHLFMQQMKQYLQQKGVSFYDHTEVTDVKQSSDGKCTVAVQGQPGLDCKNIIVACGAWSGRLLRRAGVRLPMQDGKGYALSVLKHDAQPKVPSILHEARVAVTPMMDQLRVSGTLEISGMDGQIRTPKVQAIREAMTQYYNQPSMETTGPVWYGYRPCSPDGMPYLGPLKNSPNIFLATGHAMMGLSLAPATGRFMRDLLRGIPQRIRELEACRFSD